ncbi:MAG: hypothetical protein F6K19_30490, partial [Cyanothece sp. SIO1E1]|nr:hypothetical protein [Cyanothece sp. SIO1E1]
MIIDQREFYVYQVGGSLPLQAPSYVPRTADDALFTALLAGEFCYVLNARQMGKSSLRVRTIHRLQALGICCGGVDITEIGTRNLSSGQWYASVIGCLASSVGLQIDLRTWWHQHRYLSPVKCLSDFLTEVLLIEIETDIVIFIDEIDSILGLDFPIEDFFALIRACYNKRIEQPIYRRLTFALFGVATPSDLIADRQRTPFNIGRAIPLNGFTLQDAQPLGGGLSKVCHHPEILLTEILAWTGGQPFLTQKLCQLVCQQRVGQGGQGEQGRQGERLALSWSKGGEGSTLYPEGQAKI